MFYYGTLERRFLVFGMNFRQVRKKCSLCVWMRFLVELFFYEFFESRHCFPTVGRTFCNNGEKTLEKLSKVHSTWTKDFSRKVWFLKKKFTFTIFSSFDENPCGLPSQSVPPDLENCFLHSLRGSSGIKLSICSRNFTLTNGLWWKTFGIL